MELNNTQAVINKFRAYVIQQSRSNLTKGKKNVSKNLYNSIKSEFKLKNGNISLGFYMDEYGSYQDKGVKGKYKSEKSPNSPYKFGSGSGIKGGLTQGIEKWVKDRRIQFRDKKNGRFITYKSTAFIITRSIYATGLKASLFFTKPFEVGYKKYIEIGLIEAFILDLEDAINYNLNKK